MDDHTTNLDDLDDTAYAELVKNQAHPPARDPRVWELITSPQRIGRTRQTLTNMVQRTANALNKRRLERDEFRAECFRRGDAGKQDWFDTQVEYEQWRRRAANFIRTAQGALAEVRRIEKDHNRASNRRANLNYRELLRQLSVAVHRHQAAHARAGGVAEQHDYELWQILDRITVPVGSGGGEEVTLRNMLDVYWFDVEPASDEGERRVEAVMRQAPGGRSARYGGVPHARHVGNDKKLA